MSENARIHLCSRHVRCECMRPATYGARQRGGRRRRARTDHPLCARCWRALVDHYRPAPPARRWLPDELLARVLAGAFSPHQAALAAAVTLAA